VMHISWNPSNAFQPHEIARVRLLSVSAEGEGCGRQQSGGDTFPGDTESIAVRHLVFQRNTFTDVWSNCR